jgi:hypothetical protein
VQREQASPVREVSVLHLVLYLSTICQEMGQPATHLLPATSVDVEGHVWDFGPDILVIYQVGDPVD